MTCIEICIPPLLVSTKIGSILDLTNVFILILDLGALLIKATFLRLLLCRYVR
jgi:hypothetical protein